MRLKALTMAGALAAAAWLGPAGAHAVEFQNGSFENNLDHWSVNDFDIQVFPHFNHHAADGSADHRFDAADGVYLAALTGPMSASAITASQPFTTAGGWLSGWAAFLGQDDPRFNDYGYVRVYSAAEVTAAAADDLFYSDVAALGGYGWTPWTRFSTFLSAGSYVVEAGVGDFDGENPSVLLVDGFQITATDPLAIPEPATWALMIGGFFGLGVMLRRRRRLAAA